MAEAKKHAHEQALSLLKVQGIIAIIFGALGALIGLICIIIFAIALGQSYNSNDMITYFLLFITTLLFVLIPHIYLIISGAVLSRAPEPRTARILTIINVIVGALSNYIILAFAIISLTQAKDYEDGYKVKA